MFPLLATIILQDKMKKIAISIVGILIIFLVVFMAHRCSINESRNRVSKQDIFVPGRTRISSRNNNDGKTNTLQKQESNAIEMANVISNIPNQILSKLGYTVSYNHYTKCANWVAWHLTRAHAEDTTFPRSGVPYFDENGYACGIGRVTLETQRGDYFLDLQAEEPRQQLMDWPNNEYGMEHGHLCPAADNRWSMAAMNQSFLLTNMCPQTHKLNSGVWQSLEDDCRNWAIRYGEIFIATGPIFYNGISRTIGKGKVGVPDAFYKVIFRMYPTKETIGFIYPNEGSYGERIEYVKTVDEIESITGIDFFYNLPDEIENEIEAKASLSKWQENTHI